MSREHDIRFGTTGWDYDDWVGPFYPADTPETAYLTRYAEHFDLVEVDLTFHRPPNSALIDRWRQATPRKFSFVLKVPRLITHEKVLLGCRDEFRSFAETIRGLGNKLLGVVFQFPYFNKQAFPRPAEFMERLDEFLDASLGGVHAAVEIRNKTWLSDAWFDLLRRHRAATVLVDHPWMPSIPDMVERFPVDTGPFGYVRLLGDREAMEKVTKTWEKVVLDRSDRLAEIGAALQRMLLKQPMMVVASNHYAGHAPATINELASVMGRAQPIDR